MSGPSLEQAINDAVGSDFAKQFSGCIVGTAQSYAEVPKDVWDFGKRGKEAGVG